MTQEITIPITSCAIPLSVLVVDPETEAPQSLAASSAWKIAKHPIIEIYGK